MWTHARNAIAKLVAPFVIVASLMSGDPALSDGFCRNPDPPLVTDRTVRQAPPLPEPAARAPFRDPVFGSCLVRLTDRAADLAPNDTSGGLKNEYSRAQAFNADESLILIRGIAATWYLYDPVSLQRIRRLSFDGAVDPRWDASDPNLLYFNEGTRLFAYDLRKDQKRLVRDFAANFPGHKIAAVWTRYEGSPSTDGRYWGLMAEDENWLPVAFLVYDRVANRIVSLRDMRNAPGIKDDVDHVSISPLGNYFIAAFDRYCPKGLLGSDARPCGLMVYDRNLKNGRGLRRIIGHYDLALDAEGREIIVYADIDTDEIAILRLADGQVTPLHPIDFSHGSIGLHFSGQSSRRPGWALVSTYNDRADSRTWMGAMRESG